MTARAALAWFNASTLRPRLAPLCAAGLLALLPLLGPAQTAAADAPATAEKTATGLEIRSAAEVVRFDLCSESVLHITAHRTPARATRAQTPWLLQPCTPPASFSVDLTEKTATLRSAALTAEFNLASGLFRIYDAQNHLLLQESDRRPRVYLPQTLNGEELFRASERFQPAPLEAFYGLGQHQSGLFNYRGSVVELAQANTDVALPLLVSSQGYGLLWNSAAKSWFDNRFPSELKLSAEAAEGLDYFVLYGPEMDQIIHQYRQMTGTAPLFGKWAYGFVQSKDRYKSAQELLDVAHQYRSNHVPLDFIVQDWFWWKRQGDPEFTPSYLEPHPDVPAALRELHAEHLHAMISIWAVLDEHAEMYQEMAAKGLLIPGTTDYDASNPAARDLYWQHLAGKLFAQGWDGFWLDSSEPECCNGYSDATLEDRQLAIGNGARYTNVFPLLHTGGVYDHWRATTDQKRVFLLTRSAFAGQQRYATTVWSGDVLGTFSTLRKQIPAGLNFQLSGMPYWTTDIAGYGWPYERDTRDPDYQELYTRWYEFGVFCPIFRTHGHRTNETNEIFAYGSQLPTLIAYDKLRYRLLPYIYSQAWQITSHDATLMRPLVMDWRTDPIAQETGDQYMFGPALLVSPVYEKGATSRRVYLPPAAGWVDLWTGKRFAGGQQLEAAAPLDRIPVFVKAGSILPLGDEVEYAQQPSHKPQTLLVVPGANADFDLYNDEGDTYNYEKGAYAVVHLHWQQDRSTLTLSARRGSYPGMAKAVTFCVQKAAADRPVLANAPAQGVEVTYTGEELSVPLTGNAAHPRKACGE